MSDAAIPVNPPRRVLLASLVGTTIEFYDFYLYGIAAALVFGALFFPGESTAAQQLSAFATFAIAFIARPVGAALFGHYGDRVGRKAMLVASLLVMGLSTVLIGLLPGYAAIGIVAPLLLCLLRFGQGLGLGGEWGGAALVATENAPAGRRAWYGMFPQLGAPLGFILANGLFLWLAVSFGEQEFREYGWRIPFLLSAVLLIVGLYVRTTLVESPVYRAAMARHQRADVPLVTLLRQHGRVTLLGALAMVVCYALFYIATVFALGYGVQTLQVSRADFLAIECGAIVFMAIGILASAWLADRVGRRPVLLAGATLAALSGFLLEPAFATGDLRVIGAFLALELLLMGITFGPMGAFLPELFPTPVRYTGAAVAYNLGGILGASFAPLLAQWLVSHGGLAIVGGYITTAALLSLGALWLLHETRERPLD
ncbi:MAG: MFS transporter [Pseudomonadota bacterium]